MTSFVIQRKRRVLSQICNGDMNGCSVAFRPDQRSYVGPTLVHTRAALTEICLVAKPGRPQWYGTRVWAEA